MKEALKYTFAMIGIALLVYFIHLFRAILLYLIVAGILSLILAPIKQYLRKVNVFGKKIPQGMAAALSLASFLLIIFLFFKLFAPLVTEQAKSLASLDTQYTAEQLGKKIETISDELGLADINLSGMDTENEEYLMEKIKELVNVGEIGNTFTKVFGVIGNAIIGFFSILFMTFFFLKDDRLLQRIIFSITPDKHLEKIKNIERNSMRLLRRYFIGLLIQMTIVTTMVTIGLMIVGVKNALIIGFISGILNMIPYIGPFIGAVLGISIALTTHLHLDFQTELIPLLFKVGLVYVAYQIVDVTFNQPFILGGQVYAHPLEVFVVVSIAGTLGGPLGMIIAIPGYTLVRIIAREFLSEFKMVESLTRSISETSRK